MKISNGLPVLALAAAALILGPSPEAGAAVTITANGTTCTLANAILTANTNTNIGGCTRSGANSIDRIIELTYDVTISTKDPNAGEEEDEEKGPNALPEISCHLTINAHGHMIQRDPELFAPSNGGDGIDPCSGPGEKFRVFQVGYPGGNVTLNDATVKNGCAGDEYGGGAFLFEGHELILNRVTVANNKAAMGGGIIAHESTTMIIDSTLSGNSAVAGGGIYVRTGTVAIKNSKLIGNSVTGGSGNVCVESLYIRSCLPKGAGGAIGLNGGTTSIKDSTLTQNSASSGGALYNGGATVIVNRATFSQNSAANGGFFFNEHGAANISDVTIAQNSATARGGAVYNTTGTTRIGHGTVVENSATIAGGGVYTTKKLVTLSNDLLRNPTGGNCAFAPGAGVSSAGYNSATDATCVLAGTGDHQNVPDLKLGSYTDDGTPGDGRFPLLAGSPAIDTGTPDGTLTDQVGQVRIGLPDRGAIEYPRFVKVWISEKSSADYPLRADLLAEMFVGGVPLTPSQLPNVATGRIGFANAILYTIPVPAADVPSGSTLEVRVSARRTCTGTGPASGTVRLWYDGQPVDSGTGADAGSRVGATAAAETTIFFLRGGSTLDTTAGPGGASRLFSDASATSVSPCPSRPFTTFGTWSVTIP